MTTPDTGRILVTLAPERVARDDIARLVAASTIVSLGHTAADYETALQAFDAGAMAVTHLFNAMPPMLVREPGLPGAAIDDPRIYCGLIADGFHVSPAVMRVAVRAKAPGKMILVTDAMACVGSNTSTFHLYGEEIRCENGRCATKDGTLAGSTLDMASAVRNCVELLDIDLAEAVRMASSYPAQMLGLGDRLGRIAPGYISDLVVLCPDLTVRATITGGMDSNHSLMWH